MIQVFHFKEEMFQGIIAIRVTVERLVQVQFNLTVLIDESMNRIVHFRASVDILFSTRCVDILVIIHCV